MRVLFAGTPEVAVPSLRALLASPHEVIGVLTRPDARAGRGRRLAPSPVRTVAEEAGIEVLTPAKPGDPDFRARFAELAPDVCAVVAYGAILPADLLAGPPHGWVNLHFSLLPAWRGAAPVQWALMSGDEMTGASTFQIERGLDTGPVYGVMTETIRPRDTAGELLGRLAEAGAGLLAATVDGIATGELTAVPQPTEGVSQAPKVTVDDARVDFATSAMVIDRVIRGCTPAPGGWTTFRSQRLGLGPVEPVPEAEALAPGLLRVAKHEVLVGTTTVPVRLTTVRPHGKKELAAADWARGARIEPGEVLGDA
ncbi:methionyl-tRNA formyltransferase [Janibacter sp. GXQ6167]|uniref:methionyl-tRNA formyltransferase n=1 Tax=Janibacter sp. GXQ6167 TaxID=3240791 RepID=UPI00352323BC